MLRLDPRLVSVAIEINGVIKTYSDVAITAFGTKYANPLQNECTITIMNLEKSTQDYLLTQTSPFNTNKTPKSITVYAGRQSYGKIKIYSGNIVTSTVSQPPDIVTTLKCLSGNFAKGNIITRNIAGTVSLQQASKAIAQDLNLALNYQATNKNLTNFSYSGNALGQVDNLSSVGNINAYVDDDTLVVKDSTKPISNVIKLLSADTGMIGIPEFTEHGIKVKFLIDNQTKLGGLLRIKSEIYPSINGDYMIYKLGFELSNRDTPFYYIAEARRLNS